MILDESGGHESGIIPNWEYRTVWGTQPDGQLNHLGGLGWELVAFTELASKYCDTTTCRYIFKRRKF